MKSKGLILVIAVTLTATLAVPFPLFAQDKNKDHGHHHYKLIDIPALGGPNSAFGIAGYTSTTINSRGRAVAQADTSIADPSCMVGFDCLVNHPVELRDGLLIDLGALPGVNPSLASWVNSRGWVAGLSQNGVVDPLTGSPETAAVLWKDGEIINLGTLGGNVSSANALNDRGQVVGGALNAIPDSFSDIFSQFTPFIEIYPFFFFPVATQAHAFLWDEGRMRDLGTLGGPDSIAWFINERGQVAGQSTINSIPNASTGFPTVDPFFWDHGNMVDVGNLGGTFSFVSGLNNRGQIVGTMNLSDGVYYHPFLWQHGVLTDMGTLGGNFGNANTLNDAGEVVGFATNAGDQAVFAFRWKQGVMTNLGTVDGDLCSAAHSINSAGQVVGESSPSCFNLPTTHGFLWENGGLAVDLNTLIRADSGFVLTGGVSINDRGEIAANAILQNGDGHAILLIPCDQNHQGVEGCDYGMVDGSTATQSRLDRVANPLPGVPENNNFRVRPRGQFSRRLTQRYPTFGVRLQR